MSHLSAPQLPMTPPPPFSPAPSNTNAASQVNPMARNLLSLLNFNNNVSSTDHSRSPPNGHTTSEIPPLSQMKPESGPTLSTAQFTGHFQSQSQSIPTAVMPQEIKDLDDTTDTHAAVQPHLGQSAGHGAAQVSHPSIITPQKPLFTYKNPFEALRASRPQSAMSTKALSEQHVVPSSVSDQPLAQSTVDEAAQFDPGLYTSDRVKLTPKSRAAKGISTDVPTHVNPDTVGITTMPRSDHVGSSREVEDTHDTHMKVSSAIGPQSATAAQPRLVQVMTFPVKAFISINLQLAQQALVGIRDDGVMEISRLKKEFDQTDRALAVASSKYIAYAFVKDGGIRIIRQEDGMDKHVFKHSHDRVYNVSMCTTSPFAAPTDEQAVVGTGVSGAIYYAALSDLETEHFSTSSLEDHGFVLPAFPQSDDNTAGGVLKTRAKRSSRHPEFFAVGRGRTIQIVWPAAVRNSRHLHFQGGHAVVDSEKLFQESPLQITTGKAGKDFSFSEDDTSIVSLDKSGRLRFWDVRKLIDPENVNGTSSHTVDTPILSLSTTSASERLWPTSVLFIDKARPYSKGGALRYVLVGLRQNHTLQLWDIALGKAVQEVNFPHENETDAVCSVSYHAPTGIITVGHPTRNSIFFIHLSVPRYVLSSSLSQASYLQRVAAKDPDIPRPESTACMSGIRELSFGDRGQIRSVELLSIYKPTDTEQKADLGTEALFELYVVHSRGVTCLHINRDDLGWNADHKVVSGIDAEKEGLVTLKELKLGSFVEDSSRSKSPVSEPVPTSKSAKKKSKKPKEDSMTNQQSTVDKNIVSPGVLPQGMESTSNIPDAAAKESKKNKKKSVQTDETTAVPAMEAPSEAPTTAAIVPSPQDQLPATRSKSTSPAKAPAQPKVSQQEQLSMSISGDWLDAELKKIERGVAAEIKKELDQLNVNIKQDRVAQDQNANTRQEAVLRAVSSTLNSNVEASLTTIISAQLRESVLPSLTQEIGRAINDDLSRSLLVGLPSEIGKMLPKIVQSALQTPAIINAWTEVMEKHMRASIVTDIEQAMAKTIMPALREIQESSRVQIATTTEKQEHLVTQIQQLQAQRQTDSLKIEELQQTLQLVIQAVQNVSTVQAAFRQEVIDHLSSTRIQQSEAPQYNEAPATPPTTEPAQQASSGHEPTHANLELQQIAHLMEERRYEEGSIKWLQSEQPNRLFDELFVRFTPEYLSVDVSPLVAFSIGVTIANSLATYTARRLEWIDAALDAVDLQVSTTGNFVSGTY